MASIASRAFPSPSQSTLSSDSNNPFHLKFTFANPRFTSPWKQSIPLSQSISRFSTPTICRCHDDDSISPSDNSSDDNRGWDYSIQEVVGNWIKKFGGYVNSYTDLKNEVFKRVGIGERESEVVEDEDEDWDWDRWKKHFTEIDEQQRIASVLKELILRVSHQASINRDQIGCLD